MSRTACSRWVTVRRSLSLCLVGLAIGCLDLQAPATCAGQDTEAEAPSRVAGRTLDQWRGELESNSEVARLRAVKSLASFGDASVDALVAAMDDSSEAVRYWAASALGDLGQSATSARPTLIACLERSESAAEQLSLSYALLRTLPTDEDDVAESIKQDPAFATLLAGLRHEERSHVMCSADFLGRLGPAGSAAVELLETVYYENHADENPIRKSDADYHLSGACLNALRAINPRWQPTRFAQ